MRRPSTFKGTDAIRAVRVILAAGLVIERFQVNRDGLNIFIHKPNDPGSVVAIDPGSVVATNEWDELLNGELSAAFR
jgi:hypothetical protein